MYFQTLKREIKSQWEKDKKKEGFSGRTGLTGASQQGPETVKWKSLP